jgi:hypothetical protein
MHNHQALRALPPRLLMAGVRVQELPLQFGGWWRDRLVGVVGEPLPFQVSRFFIVPTVRIHNPLIICGGAYRACHHQTSHARFSMAFAVNEAGQVVGHNYTAGASSERL